MCVCVCVCMKQRKRERARDRKKEWESFYEIIFHSNLLLTSLPFLLQEHTSTSGSKFSFEGLVQNPVNADNKEEVGDYLSSPVGGL